MIEFTRAAQAHWPALADLRAIAETTMRPSGLYTEQQLGNGRCHLRAQFERGDMHIAWRDGRPVGAIGLSESGPAFWDDDPDSAKALYISKVMATPGLGISSWLIGYAQFRSIDLGRPLLRLDCIARNPVLRALWESRGFEFLRTVDGPEYEAALFERSLR